jgi:hypothetical protein
MPLNVMVEPGSGDGSLVNIKVHSQTMVDGVLPH